MKLNSNAMQNRLNPFFFYVALTLHNYVIKKTNNSFVFVFSFVPPSIYVLVKTFFGDCSALLSFANIFFGVLLGLFDFLILFVYSNLMKNNSTYLCQSLTILPVLTFLLPASNFHSLMTAASIFVTSLCLKDLSNFERTGSKSIFLQLPFIVFLTAGDTVFFFLMALCFRFVIAWIVQTQHKQPDDLLTANMFFLSLISLLYTLFDYKTKLGETEALSSVKIVAACSCCLYVFFLLSLKSAGRQKHVFYSLFYLLLNCFYFITPTNFIFQNTRVENELYWVYLGIFLTISLIMAYVLFWYFYHFKNECKDYECQRRNPILPIFDIEPEQGEFNSRDVPEYV